MTYDTIELAGLRPCSCDDGPGVRTVIFFQGCGRKCPGCHNARTHRHGEGYYVGVDDAFGQLAKVATNKRVTISGGEPLEQLGGLLKLLLRLRSAKYDVCLYTGFSFDEVPQRVLDLLDYIKVGDYHAELKSPELHFVGSSNQRMYRIKAGRIAGELPLSVAA